MSKHLPWPQQPEFFIFRLSLYGIFFLLLLASACRTTPPQVIAPKITLNHIKSQIEQSPVFAQNFTGFALYDLDSSKMVIMHNADKYFTPASNTKILSFYAGLKILGDSIPALRYRIQHDSLIFWGTGDPTLLHPDLTNNRVWQFLKSRPEKLFFSATNFTTVPLGPGWAWDDYNSYYSAERSPLPLYGNVVRFTGKPNNALLRVDPQYFKAQVKESLTRNTTTHDLVVRHLAQNQFTFYPQLVQKEYEVDIPFIQSPELTTNLLSDTLQKPVKLLNLNLPADARTLYANPVDSLYKRMMQESDNTFAEQLLLLCAVTVFDSLNTALIINHVKKTHLTDLPDQPIWVDGSGLSRYNLITPRSIVALWQKIYQEVPRDRLFSLLSIGGKTGTLKRTYQAEVPFIFGKTGSLSNNYSQSGFIRTQSGKIYIFAFMNNNFTRPTAEIRQEINQIVTQIHQNF